MEKRDKKLTVLFAVILSLFVLAICAFLLSCSGTDGVDGKNGADGTDGKNAVIEISEDGFILVDGKKTEYRFNKKDCSIKINSENARYGKVTGDGAYAYGTAVMLTAEPNEDGVFVAWKNEDGDVISTQNNLLAVADHGETEYTALFARSPEKVIARINVKFDETTLENAVYTGDTETPLMNGVTLKFSGYGENALIMYAVEKQTFEQECAKINEDILSGKLTNGKIISYEQFVTLFNEKEFYPEETRDFYYYIVGKPNNEYRVKISASDKGGNIVLLNGEDLKAEQNYLAGTVLKLKAQPERCEINGKTFETSEFSGWIISGEKVSGESVLVYEVKEDAEITAEFIAKTKLSLTIKSGEDGLISSLYTEFKMPYKATGSINGENFETDISFADGVATVDLGYFSAGETFSLQLKLHCIQNHRFCNDQNTWRYVRLLYEYANVKIGEGNALIFFVPEGKDGKSEIVVNFVRTCNYYSNATNEKGENAKEYLYGSGYGLI